MMKLCFFSSRTLFKVGLFFVFFLNFASLVFAQETSQGSSDVSSTLEKNTTTTSENDKSSNNTVDESKITIQFSDTTSNSTRQERTSFTSSLLKFVFFLALVCGLAYVFLHFLKKSQVGPADDPFLKVAASLKVAPNKILYIITLKREAYLISVTEKEVRLISKIQDEELIDSLNIASENFNLEQKNFSDFLSPLFKKAGIGQKEKSTQGFNQDASNDFLSTMRNRLHNNEQKGE